MPVNHIWILLTNMPHYYFISFFLWSDFHIAEAVEWPGLDLKLGQVSGLALDSENNLVVFHRGDHVWDQK